MNATLFFTSVLAGAAGFLAGWWKGGEDCTKDLDAEIETLRRKVQAIRTTCHECGTNYQAMCPKGCSR